MPVDAYLFSRNLNNLPLPMPGDLRLAVSSYSRAAQGGPSQATIAVSGSPDSLAQALNWLRCPVEIVNQSHRERVWWGLVTAVHFQIGQVTVEMSLDDMANTVSVAYSLLSSDAPAGARATTADSIDADSVSEFGTKQLRYSLNNATAIQATGLAATILKERRYPQSLGPSFGGGGTDAFSVTLECRGWWSTLGWKLFQDIDHSEHWDYTTGTDVANPSIDGGHTRLAQQFQLPSVGDTWSVDSISLPLVIANLTGAGTVSVELWSDNGSNKPSAMLASGTVTGSHIADGLTGVLTKVVMSPVITITGAVPYWIVMRKPADATGAAYFSVRWNIAGGYSRGISQWWTGAAWGGADSAKDVFFSVNGLVQTTTQVVNMLTASGQFITSTIIQDASGVYSSSFRDGDRAAQAEIEDLLARGNTANQRILATVTPERAVVLANEPLPTAEPAYQVDRNMRLLDAKGNKASDELCPAGVWIALNNVLPVSGALSRFVSPSPFFAEEGRYDARSGRYTPTPKALGNVFKTTILP